MIYHMKPQRDMQSSLLNLDNPKLIHYSQLHVSNHSESIQTLPDVLVNDINNIITNKSEKKSKHYNNLVDPLEVKKNKAKIRKKTRSKIHISDEDERLENQYQGITRIDKNLEISLMRPPKLTKKKTLKKNTTTSKSTFKNLSDEFSHDTNSQQNKNLETTSHQISLINPISIQELANLISIPAPEIIKSLFLQGISVTINQVIDVEMAISIANRYNVTFSTTTETKNIHDENHDVTTPEYQDSNNELELNKSVEERAPIVTIFGHVDHGKTTLIDAISKTNNVRTEYGGITQAIIAHEVYVEIEEISKKIIFLDTPGHEAFADMRNRSIQITDIAVLVVAVDDGLQTQSKEAIRYFKERKLPFVVAINKIDKDSTNTQNIKQQLANFDILSEEWGGVIPMIEVSALLNKNVDRLLATICNMNKSQTLKANFNMNPEGTILDSYLDTKQGPVAKLLVQNGTIKVGDYILSNQVVSKVRSITKSTNNRVDAAGPSSIINVYGMKSILTAGSSFKGITDSKVAKKQLAEYQKNKDKYTKNYKKLNTRLTLDSSVKNIHSLNTKVVNLILKTDSEGTIDAIISAFMSIPQNKVQINLVGAGVGQITISDINLAVVSNANIISFLEIPPQIKHLAVKSNVYAVQFNIIYDLLDYVKDLMIQLVPIEYTEKQIGTALVENIFSVSKGVVAGCTVTEGKLKQGSKIKVFRKKDVIYTGEITSLKRIKEDVKEVLDGHDCGVMSGTFSFWECKDIIKAYDLIEQEKIL
uniref:Translation initiation factor IF-2, chloroplastic n=1 Tax=Trichogloeopsis pedicellata TaxID=1495610 RepID=A0A1G4P0J1_9FLOR|nr:Translation initiation factor 2 [Trichogloeopsis pedicellata]SCW24414.1 Translation initiation factor 2 [Trichogloeopsis pedicellata]